MGICHTWFLDSQPNDTSKSIMPVATDTWYNQKFNKYIELDHSLTVAIAAVCSLKVLSKISSRVVSGSSVIFWTTQENSLNLIS